MQASSETNQIETGGIMEGVQIGRIVHFVSSEEVSSEEKEHLAAIIVKVNDGPTGLVNLHVFNNGEPDNIRDTFTIRNVKYSTKNELYTWHWPERS